MTDKEAIELLKDLRDLKNDEYADDCDKEIREALDKGIETLENQKTGHWINRQSDFKGQVYHHCSVCNSLSMTGANKYDFFKYCPNCGAKMVESRESEDKE